jgi:glycogen operon protein
MVTDSLRYWATEMRVDGFRFDLATILGRYADGFDERHSFLVACRQDPVLSKVKLIAEPWDCGPGGYQVGGFPPGWAEWNDKFRDNVRAFWKGDEGELAALASRLTASGDLYNQRGRRPFASVNFITAHDGFTLRDVVSYDHKHNEANDENNQDGTDHNISWNHGCEGETDDQDIRQLRLQQMRNLLATLLFAQGTPMLLAGDEIGNSQQGNNNAYCQDNAISWYDWSQVDQALLAFTRRLIAIRRKHPALHRQKFFSGRPIRGGDIHDIEWYRHDGESMTDEDWQNPHTQSLAMFLAGNGLKATDREGRPVQDDHLLLMLSASHEDLEFTLPQFPGCQQWELLVDTSDDEASETHAAGEKTLLLARSLKLFRCPMG